MIEAHKNINRLNSIVIQEPPINMSAEYPRPGEEKFKEMYEDRAHIISELNTLIDERFPTSVEGRTEYIEFSEKVDKDTILSAMNRNPKLTIRMCLAVSGLSISQLENRLDISNVYGIGEQSTGLNHTDDRAQQIAPLLADQLSTDLATEVVKNQTVYTWTVNHRRHYRKKFEDIIQEKIKEHNIPLVSDSKVDGSPDIAIPNPDDSMAIVGEIRTTNKQDIGARIREFESEIRNLNTLHPNAKVIVVLKTEEEITKTRKDRIESNLFESIGDELTQFYWDENIDKLLTDCQQWTPQTQETLDTY